MRLDPGFWILTFLLGAMLSACGGRSAGDKEGTCGDGVCQGGESRDTCPEDCGPVNPECGDGVCHPGENTVNCPEDCADPNAVCGDGVCQAGEHASNCPEDCSAASSRCGNGVCDPEETEASCPNDCVTLPFMQGSCEPEDNRQVCRLDDNADASFRGPPVGRLGTSGAIVGDTDGDGFDEIIIGNADDDTNGWRAGAAYLIYGRTGDWRDVSIADFADATFYGKRTNDQLGSSVATAFDANGDGLADYLIGAPAGMGDIPGQGSAYFVPGVAERLNGVVDLEGSWVFGQVRFVDAQIIGSAGQSVAGLGDVDRDGRGDYLFVAPKRLDPEPETTAYGAGYLVYGREFWDAMGPVWLATEATTILNDTDNSVLNTASPAGDVNGDGYPDFLIGCRESSSNEGPDGSVRLFTGRAERRTGVLTVSDADSTFTATGAGYECVGRDVAGVGDLDGDGYDDFLILAFRQSLQNYYLFYGRPDGFPMEQDLEAADAILTAPPSGYLGIQIAGVGDVNADGFDDILVTGMYQYAGQPVPAVFLFLGGSLRMNGTLDVANANAVFLAIQDETDNCPGWAGSMVAGRGDVNGDGYNDFLIGDAGHCSGGEWGGYIYLVLGVGP